MKKRDVTLLLDKLLDPVGSSLNAEAATKLVNFRADAKTRRRVDRLASKCNEGELTPEERTEYEQYTMAIHIVSVLQTKARLLLAADRTR